MNGASPSDAQASRAAHGSPGDPYSLKGEVCIVSGGGSGLGLGMSRALVQAGANVAIIGRREERLKRAVDLLGNLATYCVADVTDEGSIEKCIVHLHHTFGGREVTAVVNNAGVHLKRTVLDTSREDLEQVLATHVGGTLALTRACLDGFQRAGRGSVVLVTSMAAYMGMPDIVAYTAAKAAVAGMVRQMAVELAEKNVRVNGIAPGWIHSEMLDQALSGDPTRRDKILARIAMHRFGEPDDIGAAAVYLCSPAAKYVTGIVLPVDGGALASW